MNETTKVEEVIREEPSTVLVVSPMNLIELAVTKGADVSQLEKLMDLYERWNKEQARKEFFKALANFQKECPPLKKNRTAKFASKGGDQTISYNWADLAEITSQIKEPMHNNGLSYRWEFTDKDDRYECDCVITHINGHSEHSRMSGGKETSGTKNEIQAIGSTRTYLQRYTLIAALGISTAEDDTDAITQSVVDEYEYIVKDWRFKESYIIPLVETLKGKSVFRALIIRLPYEEQTAKFIKLISKIPTEQHRKFWVAFQQQTNQTADKFLSELENKLREKDGKN